MGHKTHVLSQHSDRTTLVGEIAFVPQRTIIITLAPALHYTMLVVIWEFVHELMPKRMRGTLKRQPVIDSRK